MKIRVVYALFYVRNMVMYLQFVRFSAGFPAAGLGLRPPPVHGGAVLLSPACKNYKKSISSQFEHSS